MGGLSQKGSDGMRLLWALRARRWPDGAAALLGRIALGLFGIALLSPLEAADWPQWRGPLRSGISAETGWTWRWPGTGPKRLWAVQVGEGYSSVAVKGSR